MYQSLNANDKEDIMLTHYIQIKVAFNKNRYTDTTTKVFTRASLFSMTNHQWHIKIDIPQE